MATSPPGAAVGGVAEATLDWQKRLPPGFRFRPSDDELLSNYLKKKVDNEPIPIVDIKEVNFYAYNPQTLAGQYPRLGDNEWYFFTTRNRKYKYGLRPDRAAGTGHWKASGKDKPIVVGNTKKEVLGFKKALGFYMGKFPNGKKTNWIMHEYTLNRPCTNKRPRDENDDMKLDDLVLCRIYERVDHKISDKLNKQQRDGSTVSEFVNENVAVGNINIVETNENFETLVGDQENTPLVENKGINHQLMIQDNLIKEHYSYLDRESLTMEEYSSYMRVGYEGNDLERIFNCPKEYYPVGQAGQESFVPTNAVAVNITEQHPKMDPAAATSSSQQQLPSFEVGSPSTHVTVPDANLHNGATENNYLYDPSILGLADLGEFNFC